MFFFASVFAVHEFGVNVAVNVTFESFVYPSKTDQFGRQYPNPIKLFPSTVNSIFGGNPVGEMSGLESDTFDPAEYFT